MLLAAIAILLSLIVLVLQLLLPRRVATAVAAASADLADATTAAGERTERVVREEIARNRDEAAAAARTGREELARALDTGIAALHQRIDAAALAADQKHETLRAGLLERLTKFDETTGRHLAQNRQEAMDAAKTFRAEVAATLGRAREETLANLTRMSELQNGQLQGISSRLEALTQSIEVRMETLRVAIEQKLAAIQTDNNLKLEQMRVTVDEKLQGTLDKRLGDSFKQVSDRLEQVHKGLGEMQNLAVGVGDLKRVMTNVKTRGTWGEIQLQSLLEQILSPGQFAKNVATKPGGSERVEFAIRLPGSDGDGGEPVWLPIDAKYPSEDYQRLLEAQEKADPEAAEKAGQALETRIRGCAKDICSKYLAPPATTDFGIMFLPSEGLYAEVIRRTGLVEIVQRECRVVMAGPTTLAALLNSLQMGFRTLAIQKRSSEVWKVLGAVKTDFGAFGEMLDKVKKKLEQASGDMDTASRKTLSIQRKLKDVQELPAAEAAALLPMTEDLPTE